MAKRIWFVKYEDVLKDVFPSKKEAYLEYESFLDDPNEEYELYYIDIEDLEKYPEELEFAESYGLV